MPQFNFSELFRYIFGTIGNALGQIISLILYYSPLPDLYDIIILIIIAAFILYKIFQKLFAQE